MPDSLTDIQRILGRFGGDRPGPTVVIVAGIHGNEPAGVEAAQRVISALAARRPEARGEVTLLAGNTRALREGRRFLDLDLNRLWDPDRVRAIGSSGAGLGPASEDREQKELLDALMPLLGGADRRAPRVFLDLHTYSSSGPPFVVATEDPRNLDFGMIVPLPMIFGLQETIGGALSEWMQEYFDVSYAVEGGSHADPLSRDHHEAILWTTLVGAGFLAEAECPELDASRELLAAARVDKPRFSEVIYHHQIGPDDDFRMEPGFQTFQPIQEGDLLGTDRHGEIRAQAGGVLLMPLYQELGTDGYFIGRPSNQG